MKKNVNNGIAHKHFSKAKWMTIKFSVSPNVATIIFGWKSTLSFEAGKLPTLHQS